MNWFRENHWLGTFLVIFTIVALVALYFWFEAGNGFDQAAAYFNETATERNRLEHLDPFPNADNVHKMQVHLENYGAAVSKLKEELKKQVLPAPPSLAPNEFQSRLRQAINAITDKARANRVSLPDHFNLGFDEYTAALPISAEAAAALAQELAQIELLMNSLIDARVDAVTSLKRAPLPEEKGTASAVEAKGPDKNTPQSQMIARGTVDIAFASSPSAMRKVLNQLADSQQQFFIVRTLHVLNQQQKGPSREQASSANPAGGASAAAAASATPSGAIKFIVGNEHIDATARVELVRFNF